MMILTWGCVNCWIVEIWLLVQRFSQMKVAVIIGSLRWGLGWLRNRELKVKGGGGISLEFSVGVPSCSLNRTLFQIKAFHMWHPFSDMASTNPVVIICLKKLHTSSLLSQELVSFTKKIGVTGVFWLHIFICYWYGNEKTNLMCFYDDVVSLKTKPNFLKTTIVEST